MDERDKRRVGEQVEPGGRPKAPGRLELLQRFVNSYNHDFPREWDRLGTQEKARAWLEHKGLVSGGGPGAGAGGRPPLAPPRATRDSHAANPIAQAWTARSRRCWASCTRRSSPASGGG